MSYITVENLSLSFGEDKVLKDISLTIEKGELVTLLGPSGCGKSTLLRVLAGLEVFQEGKIFLDGEMINNVPPKNRNVGMVFQSYALFPNMTVFDNVAFGLAIKKMPREEIKQSVMKVLKLVNLDDKMNFYPHQLSGGQQQRTSLARSLVTKPKVLLLDEPFSALDAKIRKQLQLDIRKLQKQLGITMIFVTHDQEEAMILSDQIFVMNGGKIEQKASSKEMYAHPKTRFVAGFIGSYNILSEGDLQKLDPGFSPQSREKTYAIRSELIQSSPIPGRDVIQFPAQLENYTILGSTIRCFYQVKDLKITVDILNNESNLSDINNKRELFIDQGDLVAIAEN
jgi:putative spermidine/putrescine transport system ATP-binding protein